MTWQPLPHEANLFEEIYLDETSQTGHRFLVIGGIVIPRSASEYFTASIIEARQPRLPHASVKDGQPKEIGWNSINKGDFELYRKVVDAYFGFAKKHLRSALDSVEFCCSVIDTSVRGRHYSGKRGKLGFNREIYFHCLSIARWHKTKLFHVYPDDRQNEEPTEHLREILCRGLKKEGDRRQWAFRRLKPQTSHAVQALQVSDLLIGAVAYRLNRHYDAPNANPDKRALCEYILRTGRAWGHFREKSFRPRDFGRFRIWFRRHVR